MTRRERAENLGVDEKTLAALATEQRNPRTLDLDRLNTLALVRRLCEEDLMVAPAVRAVLEDVAQAVELIAGRLREGGRLIYAGAGTSGRVCVLDAVSCTSTFGVSRDLVWALLAGKGERTKKGISAEDDARAAIADVKSQAIGGGDVLIGVSASGHTPYVLTAMEAAGERGATTVAITANPATPITELGDVVITPLTGAEALTGSTRLKAGTAQKLVLNMISTATMVKLGKTYSNLMVDLVPHTEKLRCRAIEIVVMATGEQRKVAADAVETCGDAKKAILHLLTGAGPEQCVKALEATSGVLRQAMELLGADCEGELEC